MKTIIISILICLLLLAGIYFFNIIHWIYKLNERQAALGEQIPNTFRIEQALIMDSNGYFCINMAINNLPERQLIIDTKATCLARIDTLQSLGARYWDSYPVKVENTYGQKEKLPLYELESLSLGQLTFQKPLIKGISKTNAIYDLLYKEVIGKEILQHLIWKFSLDEDKLTVFSNKDQDLLKTEAEGYHQIENGLADNGCKLVFPVLADSSAFSFDMGYQGEICIDKKLFDKLSRKRECEKHLSARRSDRIDTTYVFSNMDIEWKGIEIQNCTLRYYPLTNRNMIGVQFMHRFNFLLGYQNIENRQKKDLYIQPRIGFENLTSDSDLLDLELNIGCLGEELLITSIKMGGCAEKAGVRLKDKVIEIDNGAIGLNKASVSSGEVSSYLSTKKSVLLKIEREKKMQKYLIKI